MKPADSVQIDAFELARKRMRMEGRVPLTQLARLAGTLADAAGEIDYSIAGWIDTQGRPGAHLCLKADLVFVCQRCGENVAWRLERLVDFRFVRTEVELEEVALDDDGLEAIVASRSTDVLTWIEDEAILSLPLIPRHSTCRARWEETGTDPGGSVRSKVGAFSKLSGLGLKAGKPGSDG
jgi:uncharacterized protein